MSEGIPLTDDDRQSWLQTLNDLAVEQSTKNSCVIVCSALKQKYRDILNTNFTSTVIVVASIPKTAEPKTLTSILFSLNVKKIIA